MQTNLTKTAESKTVTAKAKAFSGEGVRSHKFLMDDSGEIRVWDNVGQCYTRCHTLSPSAQRRIRALAR